MTTLVMMVVLVAGAILQALIPSWPGMGDAKVPILPAVVFYYAIARDHRTMLLAAMTGGLLQDALSTIPFGYSCVCFVAIGELVSRYRSKIFQQHLLTHMLLGALISFAATAVMYVMLVSTAGLRMGLGGFLIKATGTVLLGILVFPAVFRTVRRMDHRLGNVRAEEF